MQITKKNEIEKVIEYLRHYNGSDYHLKCACTNVAGALYEALEDYTPTPEHEDLTLQIVEQPTPLDIAIQRACTTGCSAYRDGICSRITLSEKSKCNRVWRIYDNLFGEEE